MDAFGSYRNTQQDHREIKLALDQSGSIVFAYSGDQVGALIILISNNFSRLGTMPFGGSPMGRVYVGVYGRGCNHFAKEPTHRSYFLEKLDLHATEAEWMEELWKGLWT